MLYLAEVQRKTRVLGSSKAEFKLLACQRSETYWSPVPGEELIPAPDDAPYNAGTLVILEVTGNKQIQRHSEAGRQLVSILQNFSRLQEKAKTQEEEIEQWKQSLTYQSQELNRREMEMEARQEQLHQMEDDFERLEKQRQEIEVARSEVDQLREEFERKSHELEGAWAHLQGEMNRFEEQKSELANNSSLDEEKAYQLQDLLSRLSSAVAPTEAVREQLNFSFDLLAQQQGGYDSRWHDLDQHRGQAHQMQEEINQSSQDLQYRWQQWHQAQASLEENRATLFSYRRELELKREHASQVSTQLKSHDSMLQRFLDLTGAEGSSGNRIDVTSLDRMPFEELQALVTDLEGDLEKVYRFVNSQEEELSLQQTAIDELVEQLQHASEFDRIQIETQLADERESYEMLNETLVGQRRNLQERQSVLKAHQVVLSRRQGLPVNESDLAAIDFSPVLSQLKEFQQDLSEEFQQIEERIQYLESVSQEMQTKVEQQAAEQDSALASLKQAEQDLQERKSAVAELWGRINVSQELLQSAQDSLNTVKERVEAIASAMHQFQETSDYQLQAIAEMRQMIAGLTQQPSPEYVAS